MIRNILRWCSSSGEKLRKALIAQAKGASTCLRDFGRYDGLRARRRAGHVDPLRQVAKVAAAIGLACLAAGWSIDGEMGELARINGVALLIVAAAAALLSFLSGK